MEKILIAARPLEQALPVLTGASATMNAMQRIPLRPALPENGYLINGIATAARHIQVIPEADTIIAAAGDTSIHFNFLKFPTQSGRYRVVRSGPYLAGEVNVLSGLYSSRDEQDIYAMVTIHENRISIALPDISLHYFYNPEQRIRVAAHITASID